jgi:hypothetical protein
LPWFKVTGKNGNYVVDEEAVVPKGTTVTA